MHTAASLKQTLLAHLKTRNIKEIDSLWGESLAWAKQQRYEMGGSYASFGKDISVILLIDGKRYRFTVGLHEVQNVPLRQPGILERLRKYFPIMIMVVWLSSLSAQPYVDATSSKALREVAKMGALIHHDCLQKETLPLREQYACNLVFSVELLYKHTLISTKDDATLAQALAETLQEREDKFFVVRGLRTLMIVDQLRTAGDVSHEGQ